MALSDLERQVLAQTLALQESEERHRLLVEMHPDAILVIDGERIAFANPAAARLLGAQSPEELLGRRQMDYILPEIHETVQKRQEDVIATGKTAPTMEQKWLRLDGRLVSVEVSTQAFQNQGRQKLQIVAKDVTEQRRVEGEYRRLAGLLDQAYDPNLAWDINGVINFWNRSAEDLYGYTKSDAVGKCSHELLHTIFPHGMTSADIERELQRFGCWEGELIHTAKNGRSITVESRMRIMAENAQPLVLEANRDITDRKRVEEALRQSEGRFRQLADTIPQLAWTAKPDGHIFWYNQRWYDYTGTTLEQMDGWGWATMHDQELLPQVLERWQASIASGESFDMVIRLRGADGLFRPFLTRCMALRNSEGQIIQWFGTNTDISEHVQMEESLRRSQAELEDRVRERTAAAETRATALVKSEAALREQTQLMEAILNSMGEGVVVADVDGRFLLFNPAAEAIMGVGLTEASTDQWSDVYGIFRPDAKTPLLVEELPLMKAIRGETLDDCEIYVRNAGSPGRQLTVTCRPMLTEQGSLRGGVVVFRDITSQKLAADNLKQAKEIAESANRAKSEFLAHMSHEIRTPMNGILGMTDLLLDTPITTGQREYLNSVQQSAEALLAVINDILDFSKIEAGMLDLDAVPFLLRDSLGDMLKPLAFRAHKKSLELAYHVLPDVPDTLHGDKGRLRQIIVNLVGNAIKFTEQGEIVIHVAAQDRIGQELSLHVWVSDTGIGIADDKQAAIFAPFEQADNSTARKYGGTGLGLTISTRLVEMMGGRTWLKSTVGQGSSFHFTVRLRVQDESFQPLPDLISLQDVPVLIVDDNASSQAILAEMFTHWGMKATAVADEKAALAELKRAAEAAIPFPLVLFDAALPHTLGTSLAEPIKQQQRTKMAVILMLTSNLRPESDSETIPIYHLTKPIKQSDLLKIVQRALVELRGEGTGAGLQHPTKPVRQSASNDLTLRPLRILLAEDNLINQKVALGALEKARHTVLLANNGREAVMALERDIFDLVLMDVQMPEMDGLEATAAIRHREVGTGRHVPIIALTAHAMKGDRERFLAAGMDECVTKPIRQDELWKAIASCVPSSSVLSGATFQAEPPPDQPGELTVDRATLLARIGGNAKLLAEILLLFRSECPRLVHELQEVVSGRNAEQIQRAAHTLKGTLANLSASDAFAATLRLEKAASAGDMDAFDGHFAAVHLQMQRLDLAALHFLEDLSAKPGEVYSSTPCQ